jgi:hypothetical protein
MNDMINVSIWLTLPLWMLAVWFNIRKFAAEPKQTAFINGCVLWLMFGGVIALQYTFGK